MKKVIVTGGAGFIGSHIVEELLRNHYQVTVIDNFSTGHHENIKHLPIKLYDYDITNPGIMDLIASLNPDYIIHQAAQVSVAESVQNILFDEHVNVKGSLHIIKAAIKSRVKKVVFASSAAVYGNPVELPVSTKHPLKPESPYGLTKLTVENYLRMSNSLYNLPYCILRYSNVYGPRQDAKGEGGVVAIFSNRMSHNISPFIYGDGEQTRDFVFVKDVAAANVKALLAKDNLCVNVSSGTSISVNELFQTMKAVAACEVNPVYEQARQGDIRHSILCNQETKAILDWEPMVGLAQGLEETILYSNRANKLQKVNG
ncbi:NAD-dependent epimerase/dehydratase family protein [Peribacillus glennii]|uniref:NAD-dependent epimerase/dehydratase family protein n=1 Tax=Peribacillus glennii TaxID=2303991 RepID=A0A372LDD6_9BACI|nr:NAD-dependent epimerase/dehydratase family protein [Peribacillus glennii]RFU63987.1 NAD-dependent epimerase/dehydratase family protein [Peribacillus glennii]